MATPELSPTLMAPSAQRKPHTSITLPRNFAPLGLDNSDEPRTPDQTFAELKLPPPPHHSTMKSRRSRINLDNFQARNNALPATLFASDLPIPSSVQAPRSEYLPSSVFDSDTPVPSVESPTTASRPTFFHSISEPLFRDSLRIPLIDQAPRTPPTQTKITPEYKANAWGMHRSSSNASLQSDSSVDSGESFTTRPTSFDGSTTSPDLDGQDPFLLSPTKVFIIPDTPARQAKKLRMKAMSGKDLIRWSIEMDNHLFNVYQMYLADPTVTPFKTIPGSIPPTGVCHRVARRAKETWSRASRVGVPIIKRYKMRTVFEVRGPVRMKTPEPNDFLRTDQETNELRNAWPSEGATRKRLKHLCREKFTITAHYQRLRESRSPSPFHEQFLRRPSSRLTRSMSQQVEDLSTSYATRELGISLVASGATAPLAQLVTGDSPMLDEKSDEWFNTPGAAAGDKMQMSTPSGLGIETDSTKLAAPIGDIPRLASPFNYFQNNTWNGRADNGHRRRVSHNQFDTVHATGARLLSPFRPEPDVSLNVNKRRAQHNLEDELSPYGSNLQKERLNVPNLPVHVEKDENQDFVFTGPGDIGQRRIRLRNRGATLGAVSNQARIERLFTPQDAMPTSTPADAHPSTVGDASPVPPVPTVAAPRNLSLAIPELDPAQKRLGSPFEVDQNKRSYRSRNSRHVPSLSDPFISTSTFGSNDRSGSGSFGSGSLNLDLSIGERLAMFAELHKQE